MNIYLFRDGSVLVWISSVGWSVLLRIILYVNEKWARMSFQSQMPSFSFTASLGISFLLVLAARRLHRCAATISCGKPFHLKYGKQVFHSLNHLAPLVWIDYGTYVCMLLCKSYSGPLTALHWLSFYHSHVWIFVRSWCHQTLPYITEHDLNVLSKDVNRGGVRISVYRSADIFKTPNSPRAQCNEVDIVENIHKYWQL